MNKLNEQMEITENLQIKKEGIKIKNIPGYLDKLDQREIEVVQNNATLAAHISRIKKYYGDDYLKKYYKDGLKTLNDIQKEGLSLKACERPEIVSETLREQNVFESFREITGKKNVINNNINNKQKGKKVHKDLQSEKNQSIDKTRKERKELNEEEKIMKYAEDFREKVKKRKDIKSRIEKYVKEGRKTIDDFLEKEKEELEKIHNKKEAFRDLVKDTYEQRKIKEHQ